MVGEETAVEGLTFGLEHAHRDVDARLLEFADAAALHLGEGIDAAHHDAPDALFDDQVGTGGCLAVVRAGLERYVEGGLAQQRLIFRTHGGESVDLGMGLATAHMVALADDPPVAAHDYCAHHGVGLRVLLSVAGQLKASVHIGLVGCHFQSNMGFTLQKYAFPGTHRGLPTIFFMH